MIVDNKTIKGGYSSFMIKYGITRDFIENNRALFVPYRNKLCHKSCPPQLSIYAKDTKWLWRKPKIHTRDRNRSLQILHAVFLLMSLCVSAH